MTIMIFGDVAAQIFQPYFFYALALLVISFISVKVVLFSNPSLSRSLRSILLLIPLFLPIVVYLLCFPATTIQVTPNNLLSGNFPLDSSTAIQVPTSVQDSLPQLQLLAGNFSQTAVLKGVFMPLITVPSIVGMLCIMGLIVACAYFGLMMVFGHKLASRVLRVVEVAETDFVALRQQVQNLSQEMALNPPKIGIIEDLKPNAFTLGYGRNSMVVLSIGALTSFSGEELTAVLAHELAHIKQNDFFFKTASYSLNLLSFFNPLAYFISAQALKERELLADEKAAKFLNKPYLMANVLIKAEQLLKAFPREPLTNQLSTRLFLISPLAKQTSVLAAHPRVSCRVRNILVPRPKLKLRPKKVLALTLLLVFIIVPAVAFVTSAEAANLPKNRVVFVFGAPDSATQNDADTLSDVSSLGGCVPPIRQSSNSTFLFTIPIDDLPF